MKPRKILFLCYGNLCRSPMAEGFFNALYPSRKLIAESAGVGAVDGNPASRLAVLEMKRRGIDIAAHRARNVASVRLSDFAAVIAMDWDVAGLFRADGSDVPDLVVWDIRDPYGGSAGDYREAAETIRRQVEDLIRGLP
ncbi:MAG: low molecular weight phosphatase family protein [Anaerolineales bacterium]|nr:low molecular weight phosphatase family protein [Anaerolineales bacterium]